MSLYFLTLREGAFPSLRYDYNDSLVVRAKSPQEARNLANSTAADEGLVWTDTDKASCTRLSADGPSEIILESFNAG